MNIPFSQERSTALSLPGPMGQLEVVTTWPAAMTSQSVGIVCHPHPLQQGTMNNKVVSTLVRAFDALGMPTVRFNFRGVGESEGEYAHAIGESEDLKAVLQWTQQQLPGHAIWLAGFSFGSYVAARVANEIPVTQLVSIAPPVNHAEFTVLQNVTCPWLVVQGDADEVVPADQVIAWAKQHLPNVELVVMPGVGHFFHGQLVELRELLVKKLSPMLS